MDLNFVVYYLIFIRIYLESVRLFVFVDIFFLELYVEFRYNVYMYVFIYFELYIEIYSYCIEK